MKIVCQNKKALHDYSRLSHDHSYRRYVSEPNYPRKWRVCGKLHYMAKILLVDDDTTLTSILSIGLRNKGHTVVVAHDGMEGLQKAEEVKPDLIILDVNMPKLSGFDVAMRLKETEGFKQVPIIMLTALSQDANIQRGYSFGIEDYLVKPFNVEHLFIKVKKYLP
jgi:DNA-binding response OmpR family regulator